MPFLRLAILAAFFAPSLTAQTVSTWTGAASNGDWASSANWDVLPVSGADTQIVLGGSVRPSSVQNIADPLTLNALTLEATATTSFTTSGAPLKFVAGSAAATIATFNTHGPFRINNAIEFAAPTTLIPGDNNPAGPELILSGPLSGVGNISVAVFLAPATVVLIASRNNLNYSGTWTQGDSISILGGSNALWRSSKVALDTALAGMIAGTVAGMGPGYPDRGYSQQIGSVRGIGQLVMGTSGNAAAAATVLAGFDNSDMLLNGNGGLSGTNPQSHFGKVGTGALVLDTGSASFTAGFSVRAGVTTLLGPRGQLAAFTGAPGAISLEGGTELQLKNATLLSLSSQPQLGRLGDTTPLRLAGGVLRIDGNSNAVINEKVGRLNAYAGQSTILANTEMTTGFTFASFDASSLARGGQIAFIGTNLGGSGVASRMLFTSAPATINTVLPWALSQSNYSSDSAAPAAAPAPDSLAVFSATAGVMPLSTYSNNAFNTEFDNTRLTVPVTQSATAYANTLTIDTGGSLQLNSVALMLTAGTMISRSAGATVSGNGVITTSGTLYISAAQPLTISTQLVALSIIKGGNSTLTLSGSIGIAGSGTIVVNSGTLAFDPAASVSPSFGSPSWQVSRGATLANFPNAPGVSVQPSGTVGGTLVGAGTVIGPVTILADGILEGSSLAGGLADGAGPGTLTITGRLFLQSKAVIVMPVSSVFGGQYTQSNIKAISLDVSDVDPRYPAVIRPITLSLDNNGRAALYDADAGASYVWSIGEFNSLTGLTTNQFVVDTSQMTTPNYNIDFVVTITNPNNPGTVLIARYIAFPVAIPEPAVLGLAIFAIAVRRTQRRRTATRP